MGHKIKKLHGLLLEIKTNCHFGIIWFIFIALLLITGLYCIASFFVNSKDASFLWTMPKLAIIIAIAIIVVLFLKKPMNAVYGLMGTSGSVKVFFFNFLLISFLFSLIYYWSFFHNAAVSYDVNQPHIYYNCPEDVINNGWSVSDTTIFFQVSNNGTEEVKETICHIQKLKYNYQRIKFGDVIRNTIMTSLMQEPTDFFAIASTHNEAMDENRDLCLDQDKAAMFHWLLIIQILISWIFFGVFISILYNKFRYES